jgi:hypothetical protein
LPEPVCGLASSARGVDDQPQLVVADGEHLTVEMKNAGLGSVAPSQGRRHNRASAVTVIIQVGIKASRTMLASSDLPV